MSFYTARVPRAYEAEPVGLAACDCAGVKSRLQLSCVFSPNDAAPCTMRPFRALEMVEGAMCIFLFSGA
jgi:hypothetical protein